MQKLFPLLLLIACFSCKLSNSNQHNLDNTELKAVLENYYQERLQLFPLEATQNGDNRYNDKLYADFTNSYRQKLKEFYSNYLAQINHFDRETLNENDKISYDIFKREMEMDIEGLSFNDNYFPCNQFWGKPLDMGQLGSGEGNQPFKTIKDYQDWDKRMKAFAVWTDSAIVYFEKGIEHNITLPASLVIKMIPQFKALDTCKDITKHLFYGPINKIPSSFSEEDKMKLTACYKQTISDYIIPSYKKLDDFFTNKYLPKARKTDGVSSLPDGDKFYNYQIRYWTTINLTPDEIYEKGLQDVKRIRAEMEKVQTEVGFKGSLNEFFQFLKTDKQLMPYKTPQEVLTAFHTIQKTIDPNLHKLFNVTPKTKFEIRQTEAFRAASSSAEYIQGSGDGSRPGIFYIPILDATKFNITSGMESLFLHEAIPGHHYQISLQQENNKLPNFRRFGWYGSYGEGWALYCESLGKELGLYTNPFQYVGALGDEIHRSIRLVVDVGLHKKGMTRTEAIKYMTDNEAITEEGATAEIERYMAIPGQALSYKIGSMKIRELRNQYSKELGNKFSIAAFHKEFLKDGCMPLEITEKKMKDWASKL